MYLQAVRVVFEVRGDVKMANAARYSRWALAAGLVAALSLSNYLILMISPEEIVTNSQFVFDRISLAPQIGMPLLSLSLFALGPVCLVLGRLSIREIERKPQLQGMYLVRFAIAVGGAGIVGGTIFIIFVVFMQALR